MNYSPFIYAFEKENIGVTGKGTLDGSASNENWWGWNRKVPNEPTKQVVVDACDENEAAPVRLK